MNWVIEICHFLSFSLKINQRKRVQEQPQIEKEVSAEPNTSKIELITPTRHGYPPSPQEVPVIGSTAWMKCGNILHSDYISCPLDPDHKRCLEIPFYIGRNLQEEKED